MLIGMLEAVQGCIKEELRMDTISNNIANMNVIGFKKSTISFQELLSEPETENTETEETELSVGELFESIDPSDLVMIETDMSQGDSRFTGNPLDFAIDGDGFFKVETMDGIRYTRRGNFRLDGDGYLTTQEGYRVLGTGGVIQISGDDINVNGQGVIEADGADIGEIAVVSFEDSARCVQVGNGLFVNAAEAPEIPPPLETRIRHQYLELSNVNISKEIVDMIHCTRAFESYQKAIQVLDGIDNTVINNIGQ